MVHRILEHNDLNGVVFSTLVLLLVGAAAAFIAFGFDLHDDWRGAALACDTGANALVVVAFAAAARRRGVATANSARCSSPVAERH
ncbi:MAG: hypothetical protein ACYDB2_00365 [Acidimicrobiales bacterium]